MPKIIIDFIYFCSIPFPLLYLYLILFYVSAKRYCIWKLCQCNCQHTPLHFGCWCRALCLYAWKLFDITCTRYNQMRVFIAEDSYLIQDIRTWHIDLCVFICLEKLFYKIFFFVILIWFCYGFVMVSLWLILCFFCLSSKQLWFRYGFVMVLECFIFFLWNLLWLVVSFL